VVLRGNGPTNTFITIQAHAGGYNVMMGTDSGARNAPSASTIKNATNGVTKGSQSITLTNVTGLPKIGQILMIDQLNDGTIVENDIQEGCSYCSRESGERGLGQAVVLTSSNNFTIGFEPPLHSPLWTTNRSPQVFWSTTSNSRFLGVENLSITNVLSSGTASIGMNECLDCWVQDVNQYLTPTFGVVCYMSPRSEVRRVSMLSAQSAGSQSYGWVPGQSSDCLLIDSIFANITGAAILGPQASGCVILYNFFTNLVYTPSTWDIAAMGAHDVHATMNLSEGNWGNKFYYDSIHGSGGHNTDFRNRYHGKQESRTANTMAYAAQQYILSNNIVGNILGTSGRHTNFWSTNVTQWNNYSGFTVIDLGHGDASDGLPWDDRVAPSTLVHGNWTPSIDKPDQQWDAGIADHSLPNSYFYTDKPSWFGFLTWPPYDPASPTLDSSTNIPAGYRFAFGTNPPAATAQSPSPAASSRPARFRGIRFR
jgi:hypothetical protein